MAELKRDFSKAKMNKDMDERVVGPGQYRDANNIQISTSDGSNIGSVQSLLGNTAVNSGFVPSAYSTCVGVITVPEKDMIYYLVAGSGYGTGSNRPNVWKDYIVEYDTIAKVSKYVFVDIFKVVATVMTSNNTVGFNAIDIPDNGSAINKTGIRTGMQIQGSFTNHTTGGVVSINISDLVYVTDIVKIANGWRVFHNYSAGNIAATAGGTFSVEAEGGYQSGRVLQFEPYVSINSINHLDSMLFWTDGFTEPKKIHIERSLRGTGGVLISKGWDDAQLSSHVNNTGINIATSSQAFNPSSENNADFHTRLVISKGNIPGYKLAVNRKGLTRIDAAREHITVIKKSPKFPLKLEMSTSSSDRSPDPTPSNTSPTPNITSTQFATAAGAAVTTDFVDTSGDPFENGRAINSRYFLDPVDFRIGDEMILTNDPGVTAGVTWADELALVTLKCVDAPGNTKNFPSTGPYFFEVVSCSTLVPNVQETWFIRLRDTDPLFMFKFPRFSYRYKYEDGEYSTFAPWTEVAFLPSSFDYEAKKGYNVGMVNNIRSLKLTNYFHEFAIVPRDVVGVDLLYKEDGKPTVYTVKSLSEKDGSPEWPDTAFSNYNRGDFTLTTEMIHAVVPSNQMLRPWDNVPKSALTQEMTGNRLLYANYKQGYNLSNEVQLDVMANNSFGFTPGPMKSTKTLRTYQVGVVFSDEYGRETPVLIPKEGSTVSLDKKWSTHKNTLSARLKYPSTPPAWAKYLRYYVKETSNEYYNLTQDRWYDAEDGNVWLAFPSAERNKIDEETFLVLKKEHDGVNAVLDKARYKVIAIEDDAPTFIKTTKKGHGNAVTAGFTGAQIAAAKNHVVTDAAFASGYGDSFYTDIYPKISTSNLYARILGVGGGGTTLSSKWVGVTKIIDLSTSEHAITLDQAIGDTADMDAALTAPISYRIELREDAVQHKAEFDGRFFVKILKDSSLEKHVMKIDTANAQFNILASSQLRMIIAPGWGAQNYSSTNYNHPTQGASGSAGTHQYHSADGADWAATAPTGFDSGDKFGYCGGLGETRDFWQAHPDDAVWFIDGAKIHSKNQQYNWKSSGLIGWWPNSNYSQDINGLHSSHPGGNSSQARGIKDLGNGTVQIWFGFSGWSSNFQSHSQDFETRMYTTGTIFRFRDDPNQTAYKVRNLRGKMQGYNFVKNTSGCNNCNSTETGCKRRIFSVVFERLDGDRPGAGNAVIDYTDWDPLSSMKHNGRSTTNIDFLEIDTSNTDGSGGSSLSVDNPAIWETEPKEDVGLDIYYEASGSMPLDVTHKNNELLIPLFSKFIATDENGDAHPQEYTVRAVNSTPGNADTTSITFTPALTEKIPHDSYIKLKRYDGSMINLYVGKAGVAGQEYAVGVSAILLMTGKNPTNLITGGSFQPWRAPHFISQQLGWSNCWRFGNGVESDRVRDDFNAPQLANGVKASTVLATPYAEEHRSSGMIFSGIFNSTSGVNNLNQFIMAEPITKDLNPRHGSIQALVTRNTNTVVFCEDKVLTVLTNKDALFNADGNSNVTSNAAVLGQAIPIEGDYGISTNPESLSVTSQTIFFADAMRGQVLLLQGSSISPISEIGMKDYFSDNLKDIGKAIGTFDDQKDEYNLTLQTMYTKNQFRGIHKATISFSQKTQGWTSFKSFDGLEKGISLNNKYYTFMDAGIWEHHTNAVRNNFYGTQYYSDITAIFNANPGSVKSFGTLNYEGTQSRITQYTSSGVTNSAGTAVVSYDLAGNSLGSLNDSRYKNLVAKEGWFVDYLTTDLQEVGNLEFKNKEGKWFSTVTGVSTTLSNLDGEEFSVQGLGLATTTNTGNPSVQFKFYVQPYHQNAAGSTNWDTTQDSDKWRIYTGAAFNPTWITQGLSVPQHYRDYTIDNLQLNSSNVLRYSGFDLSAEDFEVPGGTATTTGAGWLTTYIWTAAGGWNGDSGITKVEFLNLGKQGSANTIRARIFYSSFTMPAADRTLNVDIDVKATVHIPPVSPPNNTPRNSSLVVSY